MVISNELQIVSASFVNSVANSETENKITQTYYKDNLPLYFASMISAKSF